MYPSRPRGCSISKFLYWTCVILIGVISPAVLGLIAHVLVKVHDIEDIHRTSSYLILFSAAVGAVDGFVFTVLGLMGKDFHWRANITGKKYESFRLRIPAIGATIAFGAILRSIAVASYAQYDYYDAQGKIANWTDQHLGEDTHYMTPELWLCHNGTASSTACLEGEGARWLTVPLALLSCLTFCLILWIWRRGNMEAAGFIRTSKDMSQPSESTLEEGNSTPMSLKDDASEARRPVELHYQHVNELEETEIHEMDGYPAQASPSPKPNEPTQESTEALSEEPHPRFSWEGSAKTPAAAEAHSRFSWEGMAKSPTVSPLTETLQSQSKARRNRDNNNNRNGNGTDNSNGSSWHHDDNADVPEWWRD
ncbi:uncharacterized protein J3D65DRAFT_666423 [Phyllosticta citribraziliensis]|uniref:Uncharacterized protein n=1 Tax=Phyllosticta citribraziliensis TaxID=989973 RepID=A0ABR1LX16_9PEZI